MEKGDFDNISTFILRHLKSDESIIKDLPNKVIFYEYCYLSNEQSSLYQETVKSAFEKMKVNKGVNVREFFSLITQLKQICNHPASSISQTTLICLYQVNLES